jgi:DNA polymerase delta subunit 1
MRFMLDLQLNGSSWCQLPAGCFTLRDDVDATSTCHLELDSPSYKHLRNCAPQPTFHQPTLRILSFDIECPARWG